MLDFLFLKQEYLLFCFIFLLQRFIKTWQYGVIVVYFLFLLAFEVQFGVSKLFLLDGFDLAKQLRTGTLPAAVIKADYYAAGRNQVHIDDIVICTPMCRTMRCPQCFLLQEKQQQYSD